MTLIVGIKCVDGIVLGADGVATQATPIGQPTARQATKKLVVVSDAVLLGVSGPVGLAQRFEGEMETLWVRSAFSGRKPHEASWLIRESFWKYVEPEMKAAQVAANVIGPAAAGLSAISSSVVALPISKTPHLFQFDQQCSPTEITGNLPFVAVGSGQQIADPFLAFIRRIFWPQKPPTLPEGIFATLWTLQHAIKTAPGGIDYPIQMTVLERVKDNWRPRELPDQELEEHREAIASAEKSLASFRESFRKTPPGEGAVPPPKPPSTQSQRPS